MKINSLILLFLYHTISCMAQDTSNICINDMCSKMDNHIYRTEKGLKSIYYVDTLKLKEGFEMIRINNTERDYIVLSELLNENATIENDILLHSHYFLTIPCFLEWWLIASYYMNPLEISAMFSRSDLDNMKYDNMKESCDDVPNIFEIEKHQYYTKIAYQKPPDYYRICLIRGNMYNRWTSAIDYLEPIKFPTPNQYYPLAIPVWNKAKEKNE